MPDVSVIPSISAVDAAGATITWNPEKRRWSAHMPDGHRISSTKAPVLRHLMAVHQAQASDPTAIQRKGKATLQPFDIQLLSIDHPAAHPHHSVLDPIAVLMGASAVLPVTVRIVQDPATGDLSVVGYKQPSERWHKTPPSNRILLHPACLTEQAHVLLFSATLSGVLRHAFTDTMKTLVARWWPPAPFASECVCWGTRSPPPTDRSVTVFKRIVAVPNDHSTSEPLPWRVRAVQTSRQWSPAVLQSDVHPSGFVQQADGSLLRQNVSVALDLTRSTPEFIVTSPVYPKTTLFRSPSLYTAMRVATVTADLIAHSPPPMEQWHAPSMTWFDPAPTVPVSGEIWPRRIRVLGSLVLEVQEPYNYRHSAGIQSLFFGYSLPTDGDPTDLSRPPSVQEHPSPAWHVIAQDRPLWIRSVQPNDDQRLRTMRRLCEAYGEALTRLPTPPDTPDATWAASMGLLLERAGSGTLTAEMTWTAEHTMQRLTDVLTRHRSAAEAHAEVMAFSNLCKRAREEHPAAQP